MTIIDLQGGLWKNSKLVKNAPTFTTISHQLDPRLALAIDGLRLLKLIPIY